MLIFCICDEIIPTYVDVHMSDILIIFIYYCIFGNGTLILVKFGSINVGMFPSTYLIIFNTSESSK